MSSLWLDEFTGFFTDVYTSFRDMFADKDARRTFSVACAVTGVIVGSILVVAVIMDVVL